MTLHDYEQRIAPGRIVDVYDDRSQLVSNTYKLEPDRRIVDTDSLRVGGAVEPLGWAWVFLMSAFVLLPVVILGWVLASRWGWL